MSYLANISFRYRTDHGFGFISQATAASALSAIYLFQVVQNESALLQKHW